MSEQQIFAGCAWRPIPLMVAGYPADFIDSLNVGFALPKAVRRTGAAMGCHWRAIPFENSKTTLSLRLCRRKWHGTGYSC
jgi:hypothetical protein